MAKGGHETGARCADKGQQEQGQQGQGTKGSREGVGPCLMWACRPVATAARARRSEFTATLRMSCMSEGEPSLQGGVEGPGRGVKGWRGGGGGCSGGCVEYVESQQEGWLQRWRKQWQQQKQQHKQQGPRSVMLAKGR